MAVYREGYNAVDLIEENSIQIFQDACDFGAPTKKGDLIWNAAKQLCDQYGIKSTRKEDRYHTGKSVQQDVELMDEWAVSDETKTEKEATDRFRVHFVSCTKGMCRGMDGFITIEQLPNPFSGRFPEPYKLIHSEKI